MPTAPRWSVVVPVKRPEVAKTRLADLAGARRPELARAFAADTVAAALACPDVADVVVVTDDTQTAAEASAAGALVVSDEPAAGLNAALRHGADVVRRRHPDRYIAALSADLPALRPDELATTLQAATVYPVSFVGDVAGTGTTLYAVTLASGFEPRFGGRSRAAHRAAGAVELTVPDTASVHRDVDTAVDLWDAVRLGVGPRTAAVVALI
ncbi:MAG: 2-phospho-L-lactate guanylyltransferase [Jiangellaceae bacterium]